MVKTYALLPQYLMPRQNPFFVISYQRHKLNLSQH